MGHLHMRIGNQLGEILLQTAQEKIKNGECQKAIELYTESFHGFTEEYVSKVLRNEMVLVTDEDGINMNLVDDKEVIESNKSNIYDWWSIIKSDIEYIDELRDYRNDIMKKFSYVCKENIENVNIREVMLQYMDEGQLRHFGCYNIAAKLIANKPFSNLASNGEDSWNRLCANVEDDEAYKYERVLYYIVKYNEIIRKLYDTYIKIANTYKFLEDHKLIEHYPFIETTFENVIEILDKYSDTEHGYYHPMCDPEVYEFKETISDSLLKTQYGSEYLKYGIIRKNIMDGYDAGYLSPEGVFYGGIGETSAMIHLNIATQMFYWSASPYQTQMLKDGVTVYGSESPERWLEKRGWIKIHHDDIYGSFIGNKDWAEYPYCPTQEQIKWICKYADKFYNGKFYTEASCSRHRHPEPYSTYKVKQMDEIMLHEIFSF